MEVVSAMTSPHLALGFQPDVQTIDPTKALINLLPPEILRVIFASTVEDETAALNVLTQVSPLWREVAIHHPALWAGLYVAPPWPLEQIQTYLARSHPFPFSLNIFFPVGEAVESASRYLQTPQFCKVILQHLPRFRNLSIKVSSINGTHAVAQILRCLDGASMPQLQTLSVQLDFFNDMFLDPNDDWTRFTALSAPRLSRVQLSGFAVSSFNVPFSGLTSLHLSRGAHGIPCERFTQIIESCSMLRTLAIYDDVVPQWTLHTPSSVVAHELRSLQIYGSVRFVSQLILWLVAPNLEEVVIAPIVFEDLRFLLFSIASETASQLTSVKTLTLVPAYSETSDVFPVAASCFPEVEHLILPITYPESFAGVFFEKSLNIWPSLRTLSVRQIHEKEEQFLYDLVLRRKGQGHPLTGIHIDPASAYRMQRLEWLKREVTVELADEWLIRQHNALYNDQPTRFLGGWSGLPSD